MTFRTHNLKRVGTLAALALAWGLLGSAEAHDVPTRVTLQAFVKPEGDRIRLLVRVPLEAMQEMAIPEYGPGLLDFEAARESNVLSEAANFWIAEYVEIYEGGRRLPPLDLIATRISLPADRSFESWERALAHVEGELLPVDTELPWRQAMLVALFEAPIESESGRFSILPRHGRLGVHVATVLRYLPPGGGVRAFEYRGEPGLVRLDPRWHQAAGRFVGSGFFHILGGLDHLLFLVCLVLPVRRLRELVMVVTSFTVAHSITLIAATFGLAPSALWFPALVELLIAASIVYMAFENIVGARTERRWAITFAFGLVHGFGFSFVLQDTLQFAGSHLVSSLLAFNLGVELGQVFVLALLVPVLDLLYRYAVAERIGVIVLSAVVAHTAWHWMAERAATFSQYVATWPWIAGLPLGVLPWAAPLVIAAVVLVRAARTRSARKDRERLDLDQPI